MLCAANRVYDITPTLAPPPIKSVAKLSPLASHNIGVGVQAMQPESSLAAVTRRLRYVRTLVRGSSVVFATHSPYTVGSVCLSVRFYL